MPFNLGVNRSGAFEVLVERRTFGGVGDSVTGVVVGAGDVLATGDAVDVSERGIEEAVEGVIGTVVDESAVDGSTAKRGAAGV